jgi:flagellar biosynthetic protein FliP
MKSARSTCLVRYGLSAGLTAAIVALNGVMAGPALASGTPAAVPAPTPSPTPTSGLAVSLGSTGGLSRTVVIVLLFGLGTLAPAVLLLMTSFTRFLVVLLLTRNALGLQSIPPNQVLIGLSLFLTLFAMGPIFNQINHQALQPALHNQITWSEAAKKGYAPLQGYMEHQVNMQDVALFTDVSGSPRPKTLASVSPRVLIPAFVLSELRRAFLIGFIVFVPFLVIDLVVSSGLMSLGMVMLPPVMISLPLKLLLFVLVDGWGLLVRSLLMGAKGG